MNPFGLKIISDESMPEGAFKLIDANGKTLYYAEGFKLSRPEEITDTDRLEWMWKNNTGNDKLYIQNGRFCIYINRFSDSKWFDTPREAIDDAMKGSK